MFSPKMKAVIDELKARYGLFLNMHSGDHMMANLASDPTRDESSYAIEVYENKDGSIEVEAYSVLGFTMLQIKSGRFSYPNKAFNRTVRQLRRALSMIDVKEF